MNGEPLKATKAALRKRAYAARAAQPDKEQVSAQAIERLTALPEYERADVVMWYLDCRNELRTRGAIPAALAGGKTIVVPYCTVDDRGVNALGLWRLEGLDEMVSGKWQILEPPKARWNESDRTIEPRALDFIMVPGVAFDRQGGRLGNGQGYYDRLMAQVRRDTMLAGICFESQVFDKIPLAAHDVRVPKVVTEQAVYISW
ncbi:MAG: 5-formyltetrahydrofolate cyclo-ligase [Gammaproteobacteria bacterium]